jgi:hypothetical protein
VIRLTLLPVFDGVSVATWLLLVWAVVPGVETVVRGILFFVFSLGVALADAGFASSSSS